MILIIKIAILAVAGLCCLIMYWLVTTDAERELDEEEKELFR